MYPCKRILVPTDGSRLSLRAAKRAAALAKAVKGSITAVYVMPQWRIPAVVDVAGVPPEIFDEQIYLEATQATAKRALDKVGAIARRASVPCETLAVRDDHPWKAIVKAAKQCDLVAMGSHGRSGVEAMILGSETHKVLTHCATPVLVCH